MSTELKGRRVLITGGTGFLGHYLVARFRDAGSEVFLPNRSECDLTQRSQVEAAFAAARPEIVVHAAGFLGGIHFSRVYPADVFLRNLQMTCHLFEMAQAFGVTKLVNIGSACAYSDRLSGPFQEKDMLAGPMHPSVQYYGFSKVALYLGGLAFREQFGLNSIHLVPANLYGPGDKFDPELSHVVSSMIPRFYAAARARESAVVCWGSGTTVREFLYVDDCAEGVVRATELYDDPEPLNLGAGGGMTIRELASHIAQATGFNGEIMWDTSRPDGAPYKVVDPSRARERLGWTATTSFQDGLKKTVSWFAAHRASGAVSGKVSDQTRIESA